MNSKIEEELSQSIKKALSAEECAPKQKHVRACILYTWDVKGCGTLFQQLRSFPAFGNEIIILKALILFHKVVRQGHPLCLKEAIKDTYWLHSLSMSVGNTKYSSFIKTYVKYLESKLKFHSVHPKFSGTFDYEEYISMEGISEPNEGYETILELMELLDQIDVFAQLIFNSIGESGYRSLQNIEGRIAPLIPLVEESYGIYLFVVSMMTAMYQTVEVVDVLAPLNDNFKRHHHTLYKFYNDCRELRYLTSLVTVPKIPREPVGFVSQRRSIRSSSSPAKSIENEEDEQQKKYLEQERKRMQDEQRDLQHRYEKDLENQKREEERLRIQQEQELLRQKEQERLLLQEKERMIQQEQQNIQNQMRQQQDFYFQSQINEAASQLDYFRRKSASDDNDIIQYKQVYYF
jgi:flagellar biosynthesis GTPase FlhF